MSGYRNAVTSLQGRSLEIGPRSSIKLEVEWNPTIPGQTRAEFLVEFADPNSENVSRTPLGESLS